MRRACREPAGCSGKRSARHVVKRGDIIGAARRGHTSSSARRGSGRQPVGALARLEAPRAGRWFFGEKHPSNPKNVLHTHTHTHTVPPTGVRVYLALVHVSVHTGCPRRSEIKSCVRIFCVLKLRKRSEIETDEFRKVVVAPNGKRVDDARLSRITPKKVSFKN